MRLPHPPDGHKFVVVASIAGYRYRIMLIPTNQQGVFLAPARYEKYFNYSWRARRHAKTLLHRFRADRNVEHPIRRVTS